MTPKDKAIELTEVFGSKEHAIVCASMALGTLVSYGESSFDLQNMEQDIRWWDKVIDEIKCYSLDENTLHNNGWTKIRTKSDLPKTEGKYEVLFTNVLGESSQVIADFCFITRHCFENSPIDKRWFISSSRGEITNKVTHYKQLSKLPIY